MFEEDYWKDRTGLEQKHYLEVMCWLDFFEPKTVLDYGCGRGPYVHAFRYYGVDCKGFDISDFAVKNSFGLARGFTSTINPVDSHDLVVCYDVLEHLSEESALALLSDLRELTGKWILLSVCMLGDKNFELDKTHVLKRSRAWWEHAVENAGFELVEVPRNFFFGKQLIMGRVK